MSSVPHPGPRPLFKIVLVLALMSPLAIAAVRMTGSEVERALEAVPLPPATQPSTLPEVPRAPNGLPRPLLGFALNCHHIGDLPLYLRSVAGIRDLGANTLTVVTPMYQKKVDSSRIRFVRTKCPTDDQLVAILTRGKQLGLTTILMPIVLIEDPGEKDWRGLIEPDDWSAWWDSYEMFLDRFTTIAVTAEVDVLSIGSELNSTEDQRDRWTRLARRVRDRFAGRLTYSSNWDRYDKVTLWPLVDVISVSSYFELERDRPGAPEADLVRAWAPIRTKLHDFADEWKRPLILSELGYPSLPWANAHPWNYVADDDAETDHEAQARSWRAFFAAWSDDLADPRGGVVGVSGYRWDPYHHGQDYDTGYGILGKPAHEIIHGGFAEIRRRAALPGG